MSKPILPKASRARTASNMENRLGLKNRPKRTRRSKESSDVLVSAVISTYLLNHLHHVLQLAEYGAINEGRDTQAANFAQLRKVLCMDARSMKDASAFGMREGDLEKFHDSKIGPKVA